MNYDKIIYEVTNDVWRDFHQDIYISLGRENMTRSRILTVLKVCSNYREIPNA